MTNEKNITEQSNITQDALAHLGDGRIAYVKQIQSEDVRKLFPQAPQIAPGIKLFALMRGERHADHADRHARSRARQCLEPGARDGQRPLSATRARN